MGAVDTAWLRLDDSTRLMAIKGVLFLRSPLPATALRRLLEERLLPVYPRFRQRVVLEGDVAWWEDDPQFDLRHHLRVRRLRPRAGESARDCLHRRWADWVQAPLDARHPLWSMELFERVDEGSVLCVRVHHCVADGMALVEVVRSLTEEPPNAPEAPLGGSAAAHAAAAASQASGQANDWSRRIWEPVAAALADPQAAAQWARQALHWLGDSVQSVSLRPPRSARPRASALGGRQGRQGLAWSEALALDEVKAVARALGASVHEVLASCVTEALRRSCDGAEDRGLRALVPMNLRRRRPQPGELGNRFGMVQLELPVDEANPYRQLDLLHERLRAVKASGLPPLSWALMGWLGHAPAAVQQGVLAQLADRASLVLTHVPGPQQPVRLAGVEVEDMLFWVPQSGSIGLGISLMGYAGKVRVGVLADATWPEPQRLCDAVVEAFERMAVGLLLASDDTVPDASELQRRLTAAVQAHQD